jgi:hypothetical protein
VAAGDDECASGKRNPRRSYNDLRQEQLMAISGGPLSGGPIGAAQQPSAVGRRPYPYLTQAGLKLKIAKVEVEVIGAITGGGAKIRGKRANEIIISETALSLVSGIVYEANSLEVTTAFANRTAFYDTFDINWEVSRDGGGPGGTWEDAGTSKNPIYVCLANPVFNPSTNPILSAITMFRTVVHLACSVGGATNGATNKDDAVTNTWSMLSGRTFKTWDDKALHYYRKGTTRRENSTEANPSVAWLLRQKTGQCGCWALMFQHALTINGINWESNAQESSFFTTATCQGLFDSYFWVKHWDDLPTSDGEWLYFQSDALDLNDLAKSFDMRPPPPDGDYGHYDLHPPGAKFENMMTGLPGQNSATNEPPSQKVFTNHQFVKYTKLSSEVVYYDPSYGVTYANAAAFQAQLNGYGDEPQFFPTTNPTRLRLEFKLFPPVPPGDLIIGFDH